MVVCNHVLEHVKDYKRALNELRRIISLEGYIIISFLVDLRYSTVYENPEVITEKERIEYFGQNDHLRVFGKDSKELLESFGFEVTEIRGDDYDKRIILALNVV